MTGDVGCSNYMSTSHLLNKRLKDNILELNGMKPAVNFDIRGIDYSVTKNILISRIKYQPGNTNPASHLQRYTRRS